MRIALSDLHKRYQRWLPIAFFLMGFIFDTITLRRIDEPVTIIQQAIYLIIAAGLVFLELIEIAGPIEPHRFLKKAWQYREFSLQFLLGTLLNSYTIFYFKSASAVTSFIFIIVLVALLLLNEFLRFGESQAQVHMAFISLCLISFLQSLFPILLGFIGLVPFLCGLFCSILIFFGFYLIVAKKLNSHPTLINTHVLYPYAAVQSLFFVLYFANAIPPVPLSVPYMGIYHDVKKQNGKYELTYTRPRWKFWQNGDQTFLARPGDVIHCYAQIFSPAKFRERLQVRWLHWDEKQGWQPSDAIALEVTGGRDEGFRTVTKKSNFQTGLWRAQIETTDNQEIGRIKFNVETDDETDPRDTHTELK